MTAEQLRDRSWWTGSEVYVLVDDYDLVSTSRGNPLRALVPYLAQASDLGLHVVVAAEPAVRAEPCTIRYCRRSMISA